MGIQAELFDGTVLDFEDGTPDHVIEKVAKQETERLRTEAARQPLPEGVKPSEAGAGRGAPPAAPPAEAPAPSVSSSLGGVVSDIRGNEAARAQRLGQSGAQPLPAGVKPSEAGGGRGSVNPYNAVVRRADQPFADKQEALDEAVNLIEEGADRETIYREFERMGGGTILRSDIEQRGLVRGSPAFKAATNAGTARDGAQDGTMTGRETGVAEGVGNFGKRVMARTGQAATGVMAGTGLFGTEGLAASLARDQKRLEAAAPGEDTQRELESLSQVKTYAEIPAALVQNPRGAAVMLFESLAMTAPLMAGAMAGLPGKGLAAVTGAGSGGLEYGSALADMLGEAGISLLDAAKVKEKLDDPKFMEALREKAVKRGLAVGTFDALTAGFAGKFLEPALAQMRAGKLVGAEAMRATAGAWAKELGMQMAGGAGGEKLAQELTGEDKPLDVAMEALGEMAGAPLEIRSNLQEAKRAQTLAAFERAAALGFQAQPVLATDTPDVARRKTLSIFQGMAAQYGIPDAAVKRAAEAVKDMPLEKVGPFLDSLTEALTKRGQVARAVDPQVRALLNLPPLSEEQADAALADIEAQGKATAEDQRQWDRKATKPAAAETKPAEPETPAPVSETPAATGEPEEGDILTKAGNPFASERSAQAKLKDNPGHEVVPVDGGFVVRKQVSVEDIHQAAEAKKMAWNDDPAFLQFTWDLTGKEKLDELTPAERRTVLKAIQAEPARTSAIDAAARQAATSLTNDLPQPTPAQREAGNYPKGHDRTTIPGLDLSIENDEGSIRSSKPGAPVKWKTTMKHHYGYIRGTVSIDGDHVDVFVKPGTAQGHEGPVFVVDQQDPATGKPDEHKVMLGFATKEEAQAAYQANYQKGWKGLRAITETSLEDFKKWAFGPDTRKPFNEAAYRGPAQPDVQPPAGEPAGPAAGRGDQPVGGGRPVGRAADTAPVGAPAAAPAPGARAGEAAPNAGEQPDAVANPDGDGQQDELDAEMRSYERKGEKAGTRAADDKTLAEASAFLKPLAAQFGMRWSTIAGGWTKSLPDGRGASLEVRLSKTGTAVYRFYLGDEIHQEGEYSLATVKRDDIERFMRESFDAPYTNPDQSALEFEDPAKTGKGPLPVPAEDFNKILGELPTEEWNNPFTSPGKRTVRAEEEAKRSGMLEQEAADQRVAGWKAHARKQGATGENASKTVLSLFDASGEWAKPWSEAGYNVITIDLQDGRDVNDFDAATLLEEFGNDEVYAILAAPPCTDFTVSGNRFWAAKEADGRLEASIELVRQTLRTVELFKPPIWAMENPVGRLGKMDKDGKGVIDWLAKPRMSFGPWVYGDPYTKRTLLWGDFDEKLPQAPVEPVEGSKIANLPSTDKYGRSLTPEGFAYAFFMANNAIDLGPAEVLARQFRGIRSDLLQSGLAQGLSEQDMRQAIEDPFYDGDLEAANQALKDILPGTTAYKVPGTVFEQGGKFFVRFGDDRAATGPMKTRAEAEAYAKSFLPKEPAGLSDEEAFADDYAHFAGREVELEVSVEGAGQPAVLKMDAAKAMRDLDDRVKTVEALRDCISRAA